MVFFAERKKYSQDDIFRKIEYELSYLKESSSDIAIELFNYANKKRIIIPIKESIDDSIDIEPDEENDIKWYSFRFVGLIIYKDISIFVYPKYYLYRNGNYEQIELEPKDCEEKVKNGEFSQIVRAIEKYRKKAFHYDSRLNHQSDDKNMLALKLFFLNDYFENGIYSNKKTIYENNGLDEIVWDKTISSYDPIISNGKPYYIDTITSRFVHDDENLIANIHRSIVIECSDELERTGILDFMQVCPIDDVISIDRKSLGDDDFLCRKLRTELSTQFNTHKREVLKNLINYIDGERSHGYESEPMFFGTVNFHALWEQAILQILMDHKEKSFSTFGVNNPGLIRDAIDKHVYMLKGKGYRADVLKPDCVHIEGNKFFIIDAKYYCYELNEDKKTIAYAPGVGDVNKQYLYQKAFKKPGLNFTFYNCFALPSIIEDDGIKYVCRGFIHMPLFNNDRLVDIKLIHMDARKVLKAYTKDETWPSFFEDASNNCVCCKLN